MKTKLKHSVQCASLVISIFPWVAQPDSRAIYSLAGEKAETDKSMFNKLDGKKVDIPWSQLSESFKNVYRNLLNKSSIPKHYQEAILREKMLQQNQTTTQIVTQTTPLPTTPAKSFYLDTPFIFRKFPTLPPEALKNFISIPNQYFGIYPCDYKPYTFTCGISYCTAHGVKQFTFKPRDLDKSLKSETVYDFDNYIRQNPNSFEEKLCREHFKLYAHDYYKPDKFNDFALSGVIKVAIYINGNKRIGAIPFTTNKLVSFNNNTDDQQASKYSLTFFEIENNPLFPHSSDFYTYLQATNLSKRVRAWKRIKNKAYWSSAMEDRIGTYEYFEDERINPVEIFADIPFGKNSPRWNGTTMRRLFGGELTLTLTPFDKHLFNAKIEGTATLSLSRNRKVTKEIQFSTRTPVLVQKTPLRYIRKDRSKLVGEVVLHSDTYEHRNRTFVKDNFRDMPDFEPFEFRFYVSHAVGQSNDDYSYIKPKGL
ncbi:hypothetical protein [Endozoicomonas lisbonensis]|uniref:Uncharacterized protein n=1 Tax=Endozoicomonas lisbonensis TaxID=3120522 RepID=A0ABV2SIX6_9GAMM